MDQNSMKEIAGKAAVDALVRDNMKIGLGSGSTAIAAVRAVGSLLRQGKLKNIKAVVTSFQTELACEEWCIPVYSLNSGEINGRLNLAIDGADQIDSQSFCVKGGGGALLLEKIVAYSADAFAVVVDESKTVEHLGITFPVAVEVIPEARVRVQKEIEKLGASAVLREALRKVGPIITDHGNFILDISFKEPVYPALLEEQLNHIAGVVENGFFTKKGPHVFIGKSDGRVEVRG
jgi:ribose 5-phosphate isomerase A